MPKIDLLALDRSARYIDADGRLHVDKSHISKTAVNPYYGREIPGYQSLGLDPEKIYQLFRDPVELERAAETFARLPILSKHVPVTVDTHQPDLVVGTIGSNVAFNPPYLDADLCIWDASAIAGIESETVIELSCGYRYVPVMEPGEFEGKAYDGIMTQIRGNHLALVETGRAGSDVVVADQNPFLTKVKDMKMTKLGKAIFAALSAISPVLAADSAMPALVANATRKNFNKSDVSTKLMALDATLNPQQLDNVIDALLDVEQDPNPIEPAPAAAADESPAEKIKALLAGKVDDSIIEQICSLLQPATDEFPDDDSMKKEDVEAAMDALSVKIRTEMREANEAAKAVRDVVGDVAMDSAEEIYGFALDHMKVDRKGVTGSTALRALFHAAHKKAGEQSPVMAQDSAGVVKKFPGIARFKTI